MTHIICAFHKCDIENIHKQSPLRSKQKLSKAQHPTNNQTINYIDIYIHIYSVVNALIKHRMFSFFTEGEEEDGVMVERIENVNVNNSGKEKEKEESEKREAAPGVKKVQKSVLAPILGFLSSIDEEITEALNKNERKQNSKQIEEKKMKKQNSSATDEATSTESEVDEGWVVVEKVTTASKINENKKSQHQSQTKIAEIKTSNNNNDNNNNSNAAADRSNNNYTNNRIDNIFSSEASGIPNEGMISSVTNYFYSALTDDFPNFIGNAFNDDVDTTKQPPNLKAST